MFGIKDLKNELAATAAEMKVIGSQIGNMAEKILILSESMSNSMNKMTAELSETNKSIRDSLKVTSETIQAMSNNFSKSLDNALDKMSNMKMSMNIKDTIIRSLGLDGILPEFLKK